MKELQAMYQEDNTAKRYKEEMERLREEWLE